MVKGQEIGRLDMGEVGVRRGRGNGLMKLKINKYHYKAKNAPVKS